MSRGSFLFREEIEGLELQSMRTLTGHPPVGRYFFVADTEAEEISMALGAVG
jgi:hypothetical protein